MTDTAIAAATVLFYASLCAACLFSAAHSRIRDRRAAIIATMVLMAGCLLSNVAWVADAVGSWKRIDAAAMMIFMFMLWRDRRPWKARLAASSVIVMGLHGFFGRVDDGSAAFMYAYPAALNAMLVVQLAIIGRLGAKGALDRGSGWVVTLRRRRSGRDTSDVVRLPRE